MMEISAGDVHFAEQRRRIDKVEGVLRYVGELVQPLRCECTPVPFGDKAVCGRCRSLLEIKTVLS